MFYSDIMVLVQSNFMPPKPIRGGIPLCFPQVCAFFLPISILSHLHVLSPLVSKHFFIDSSEVMALWNFTDLQELGYGVLIPILLL